MIPAGEPDEGDDMRDLPAGILHDRTARRAVSMISWVAPAREESPSSLEGLTWDLDDDEDEALGALLDAGECDSVDDALPRVVAALARDARSDRAAVWLHGAPGADELRLVVSSDGAVDDVASARLARATESTIADEVAALFGGLVSAPSRVRVVTGVTCAVWFALSDTDARAPDRRVLRLAGLALRGAIASTSGADDARVIAQLTRAAVPSLVASHATASALEASLEAELAGLRALHPKESAVRACAMILQESRSVTLGAWKTLSGLGCLTDDQSRACDPAQVLQSVVALVEQLAAGRAQVNVQTPALPAVGVTPSVLAGALVRLASRLVARFEPTSVRGAGRVLCTATASERGVEFELRAQGARRVGGLRPADDAVAEGCHGALAAACGGAVEMSRDAVGVPRYRVVVPRA